MPSLFRMKQILNPVNYTTPEDDFRILDSWTETGLNPDNHKQELKFMCYKIETIDPNTGRKTIAYKAVKFAKVERLPKSAKESTALMQMQSQILSASYQQNYNLVTIIANVIHPVPQGLMYLYGVQGVSMNDIEEAKKIANYDYEGFIRSMMGTFRVLHMRTASAEEAAWLSRKMRDMKFLTAIRGIPKAAESGEDGGNKGIGGQNVNPNSQGTLEEIITALADYEYVIEVLSTPVHTTTLMGWSTQTQKDMTEWYGQLQGTKSLSMNISIPMTYMTSTGSSQGWSRSVSDSRTVSFSQGESYNSGFSQSAGQSLSQSIGESFGISKGQSVTNTTGQNYSVSNGITKGVTEGVTHGMTRGQTVGQTIGYTQGLTRGYTQGVTKGVSTGTSMSMTQGNSLGTSMGQNRGVSLGQSQGESMNQSYSSGVSDSKSLTNSSSTNLGSSYGQSLGNSINKSYSENSSLGHNISAGVNDSYGSSKNYGVSGSHSDGTSYSTGQNGSTSLSQSNTQGSSHGSTSSYNNTRTNTQAEGNNGSLSAGVAGVGGQIGANATTSQANARSSGGGTSDTTTNSNTTGVTNSNGWSTSSGETHSDTSGWSAGTGTSESHGSSMSEGYSTSRGSGYSEGYGASYGQNQSLSYSNGKSESQGHSVGKNDSTSLSQGINNGTSYGQTAGTSYGQNAGQSYSVSISQNKGTSYSSSMSQSISQSESISNSQSQSESLSESMSNSQSQSLSQSRSESTGQSVSKSIGESTGESYTQSVSNGTGKNWSESSTVSNGKSNSTSEGTSQGTSMGSTGAFTTGTSGSMGLGPSIGYSKSYQWLDQQVKDILEILEYQNERLKQALRSGAFYTYLYIACPNMDVLAAAQAAAKSTWQNDLAFAQPIQALDLTAEEQQHLLYHFTAFSADYTRENVAGVSDYKYATVLLPKEYVAYTHLPRVSEGGIDTIVEDIPKFRVPGMLRGNIYMGTQLNPERYTFRNGYKTEFDYRINIDELMHGVFTGQSRSGKTVAAMRFIRELANSKRTATGKRLRIVIMDPKQDWRGMARFVEPERFRFYSMGNVHFRPINLNPCKIPYGVEPQHWIDGIINIYCRAYGLLERGKQMLGDTFYRLYEKAGVFKDDEHKPETWDKRSKDWKDEISRRSGVVTFHKIYKDMEQLKESLSGPGKRAGNDTMDAYARLLERLSCFSRRYSIEYRLFSAEGQLQADGTVRETTAAFDDINSYGTGLGVDELIGADDVTVFESFGLESTFANFIFGIITSGFYKVAKGFERGYLNPAQYETVLVIEEANKVLTGNDTAGTGGGGGQASLSGQSEFEEILDQSAGYGLFIIAITQKISMMPSSIIANCGLLFMGKLSQPEDVDLGVRMIGREGRIDDRDVVKWLPKSPTGWFICRSNRGYDFRDAEPVLVQIEPLNNATVSNAELEAILVNKEASLIINDDYEDEEDD